MLKAPVLLGHKSSSAYAHRRATIPYSERSKSIHAGGAASRRQTLQCPARVRSPTSTGSDRHNASHLLTSTAILLKAIANRQSFPSNPVAAVLL